MLYITLILTVLFGALIWKAVKRNTATAGEASSKKENEQTNQAVTASSLINYSSNSNIVQCVKTNESAAALNNQNIGSSNTSATNLIGSINKLQQKLLQEMRKRENAEDWAELLILELNAYIQACTNAEQRYKQLERKHNPDGIQTTIDNSKDSSTKTFKSISDSELKLKKTRVNNGQAWEEKSGNFTEDKHLEEVEWNQIVQTNIRYLQSGHQQNKTNKKPCTRRDKMLSLNKSHLSGRLNSERLLAKNIQRRSKNTVAEKNCTEEKLNAQEMKAQHLVNSQESNMPNLRHSNSREESQDQSSRHLLENQESVNPLVCMDSLDDIKTTTQIWENLSIKRENSASPSSPTTTNRASLHGSCSDITEGLVKRNSKLYENS